MNAAFSFFVDQLTSETLFNNWQGLGQYYAMRLIPVVIKNLITLGSLSMIWSVYFGFEYNNNGKLTLP